MRPAVLSALFLLASVWVVLLGAQAWLGPWLGEPAAVCVSFLLATALVLGARPRRRSERLPAWLAASAGAAAGYASHPLWIALISGVGTALGLPAPLAPTGSPGLLLATATILLAPLFEELLYRERLLEALRPSLGTAPAVLASSAAFAVSHVEPWAVLGTFLVGIGLGAVMCRTKDVALCVGLHAGLNLAAAIARPPA